MEATALMEAAGGPLVRVFEQIVQTRREILPKVDKPVYEDGRGITGWVGGHRVLIGNRDLLAAHQINPLTHEKEKKYTAGGKKGRKSGSGRTAGSAVYSHLSLRPSPGPGASAAGNPTVSA